MRIGDHNLTETDANTANQIMKDFLQVTSTIIEGQAYGYGRSVQEDKNYRLNVDRSRYIGIKLRYNQTVNHTVEFVVRDIRTLLGFTVYSIKQITGFPMNGDKWRQGDCLISDWGTIDQRTDLRMLSPSSILASDKEIFLQEIGRNGALSYGLGLWDRGIRNFVWDSNQKKIISIDHEIFSKEEVDQNIAKGISQLLDKFFCPNWYQNKDMSLTFTASFNAVWSDLVTKRTQIESIYKGYDMSDVGTAFIKRIAKPAAIPLSLIMT